MTEYKMIPVDEETKKDVVFLAKRFGFGERGQGAMVRMLVKEKLQKLGVVGASAKDDAIAVLPAVGEDIGPMPAIDDVA